MQCQGFSLHTSNAKDYSTAPCTLFITIKFSIQSALFCPPPPLPTHTQKNLQQNFYECKYFTTKQQIYIISSDIASLFQLRLNLNNNNIVLLKTAITTSLAVKNWFTFQLVWSEDIFGAKLVKNLNDIIDFHRASFCHKFGYFNDFWKHFCSLFRDNCTIKKSWEKFTRDCKIAIGKVSKVVLRQS